MSPSELELPAADAAAQTIFLSLHVAVWGNLKIDTELHFINPRNHVHEDITRNASYAKNKRIRTENKFVLRFLQTDKKRGRNNDLREVETLGRRLLWEKLNLGQCRMFEIPRAIGRATATMQCYLSQFMSEILVS